MNKFGSMILRISLSLCIIKDMWTIYLFKFRSPLHFEKFNKYLNTKHANINLTSEKEVNGSLPFLMCWYHEIRKVLLQQFSISLHLVEFTSILFYSWWIQTWFDIYIAYLHCLFYIYSPITVKHAVILKLELVNTQVFHL